MSKKIALILDKSQAYIDFQKESILTKWAIERKDIKTIEKISQAGGVTLFGDLPASLLTLEEPEDIKSFISDISLLIKNKNFDSILDAGIIIMSSANRNSTKKLEALVEELEGTVYANKSDKNSPSLTDQVVSELNLQKNVKEFLVEYLGDDYEGAISIVRNLSEYPKSVHESITIDDLYIRLPQAPGSIPPWDIEKYLWSGNISKALEVFRRVDKNSHYLVVLTILKNKVQLAFRVSSLIEVNPNLSTSVIASTLNARDDFPLKLALGNSKKLGPEKLEKLAELIADTERKVKGYSSAKGSTTMEVMLVKFSNIIKG